MITEPQMVFPMRIDATALFRSLEAVSNRWKSDIDFSRHMNRLFQSRRSLVPGGSPYPSTFTTGKNVNLLA